MNSVQTKFWHYNQNNSGGSFDFDEDRGITHHVVVEATSAEHADSRLEEIGGYFNGCDDHRDCPCCGDRWSTAFGNGDEEPEVYGRPAKEHGSRWMEPGKGCAVHCLDGRVEWF